MKTQEFHLFLKQAQRNLISDEESKTGCVYMDALKLLYPSMYSKLPQELNTALYREHTPLLFDYLIENHER